MEDPLWRCLMIDNNSLSRDQLELVVQKKKLNEIFTWFQEHFVTSSLEEYIKRCPIVILQGPTGCGKTATLQWISKELKISFQEFNETTDISAINHDLVKAFSDDERINLSHSIDRRKALKFEQFVMCQLRYTKVCPVPATHNVKSSYNQEELPTANESEFDDSDDEETVFVRSGSKESPKLPGGVVIHIESPLTFARSQRVLIQSLQRLLTNIREQSRLSPRRIAIVFESVEGESESISLPSKIKQSFGIATFKFNPIIRANMKRLIESLVMNYKNLVIEKETVEQLVNDCCGDIRACINTLQLICNYSGANQNGKLGSRVISRNSLIENGYPSLFELPTNKKQKLHHEKMRPVKLSSGLMRDNTRSLGFFHVIGKIFYQKRLYPDPDSVERKKITRVRKIDRPYPTENSTEYLANMVDVDPKNLIAWLHQHYHKFCRDSNVEKADLFLENLTTVDTTSLASTQSSQFYEAHNIIDQLQNHLAIESTVFSLYEDQSNSTKSSHKKILTEFGYKFIKSSVENPSNSTNGELYSFNKPITMSLPKVVEDYQSLLRICTSKLLDININRLDSNKILLDYVPYLNSMSNNWSNMSPKQRQSSYASTSLSGSEQHPIYDNYELVKIMDTLETLDILEEKQDRDWEMKHERLMEMLDEVEVCSSSR